MDDVPTLVQQARFSPVRIREGYDMGEVDAFLDRVVAAWWAGEPLGPLCDRAQFTPVRMREGYDVGEVDAFLDRVVAAPPCPSAGGVSTGSTTLGGVSTGSTTGNGVSTSSTGGDGVATGAVAAGNVIQEQKGLFSRLFGKG